MLQKGFFRTMAVPYKENPLVSLSGGEAYEENRVFVPGFYSIDIQAGAGVTYSGRKIGLPAKITQTIKIKEPFIVRAYCGGSGTSSSAGVNPYSGVFKVNAYMNASNVPAVSHIFGNSGSSYYGGANTDVTSGNCLGNGARVQNLGASGAGSCLHLLPEGGTFGTNYLFAFHTTAGASGASGSGKVASGVGSAYGGAGSGTASRTHVLGAEFVSRSYNAGSTPYGAGGSGVPAPSTETTVLGNNGTGIGYGYGGGVSLNGVGAWFNGTEWLDSRATGDNTGGHIIITFLGAF